MDLTGGAGRLVRALATTGIVAAVVLGSLLGLDEWADAAATHVPAGAQHSTRPS